MNSKVKPYAFVRGSNSGGKDILGPDTLVNISVSYLTNQIFGFLNEDSWLQDFRNRIQDLPVVLINLIEFRVYLKAKVKKCTDQDHLKIWKIFFRPEDPTENVSHTKLLNIVNSAKSWNPIFEELCFKERSKPVAIKSLTLSVSPALDSWVIDETWTNKFEILLKKLPFLNYLHLCGGLCNEDCFHLVARYSGKTLQYLKISDFYDADKPCWSTEEDYLSFEGIVDFVDELLKHSTYSLRIFDLSQCLCNGIGADSVIYLNKIRTLEEVHIRIHHLDYFDLAAERFPDLLSAGNEVRKLHLHFNSDMLEITSPHIRSSYLSYLEEIFPKLESLNYHSLSCRLGKHDLLRLHSKNVEYCDLAFTDSLNFWTTSAPRLKSLKIHDIDKRAVLTNNFTTLNVCCFYMPELSLSFKMVAKVLKHCKVLEVLSVETEKLLDVSDAILESSLKESPHLKRSLTEFSLVAYRKKVALTCSSVETLLEFCPNLKKISNIVYWLISRENISDFISNRRDVHIRHALFLPDDVIPL